MQLNNDSVQSKNIDGQYVYRMLASVVVIVTDPLVLMV